MGQYGGVFVEGPNPLTIGKRLKEGPGLGLYLVGAFSCLFSLQTRGTLKKETRATR